MVGSPLLPGVAVATDPRCDSVGGLEVDMGPYGRAFSPDQCKDEAEGCPDPPGPRARSVWQPSQPACGLRRLPRPRQLNTQICAWASTDLQNGGDQPSPQTPLTSKTPGTNSSSADRWHEAEETLLIFDWDDTLCPTTHFCKRLQLESESRLEHQRCQHMRCVETLLRLAVTLGRVKIVTLGQEGWVPISLQRWMPELEGLLEELGIEVVYARSAASMRLLRLAATNDSHELGNLLKRRAMHRVVTDFYRSGRPGCAQTRARSWKNVLSVGDSHWERLALQDVIMHKRQVSSRGAPKPCRCKVLKTLSKPTLDTLIAQVQVLTNWMQVLVVHDGDIDLDFEELSEDSPVLLNKLWSSE